jgi:hypothetical protein
MTALETSRQPLILLGGMGLQPSFKPFWKEILGPPSGSKARIHVVLPVAEQNKPPIEQRARLAEEMFTSLEMAVQVLRYPPTLPDAPGPGARTDWVFVLVAADPLLLPDTLWQWHKKGLAMILSATVAVAIGEHTFTAVRPYPSTLEALDFSLQAGAGMLPGAAILPYFDRFPPGLLDKLQSLLRPGTTLVGIGEQAALVSGTDSWHVGGLGSVTILSDNQAAYVAQPGESVPDNLLPLYQ